MLSDPAPASSAILLVDDDEELVDLLQNYLEREGFAVGRAEDGEEGVREALSGRYAIAVVDIMMPRMNGIEVLKAIRSRSNMPVIMLTAKGDDTDRIVGLEIGADDYIPKPCTPRELTARIRAILRRKKILSEQGLRRPLAPFDRSVDVHVSGIRQKLGLFADGRSCIVTVYRLGYQLVRE